MKKIIALISLLALSACQQDSKNEETAQSSKNERAEVVSDTVDKVEQTETSSKQLVNSSKSIDADNLEHSLPETKQGLIEVKDLRNRILNAAETLACDNSAQCYVVATGSSPCGGASGYQVLSEKSSDKTQITSFSQKLVSLERSIQSKEGMAGICRHIEKPASICKNNVCVETLMTADGRAAQ